MVFCVSKLGGWGCCWECSFRCEIMSRLFSKGIVWWALAIKDAFDWFDIITALSRQSHDLCMIIESFKKTLLFWGRGVG